MKDSQMVFDFISDSSYMEISLWTTGTCFTEEEGNYHEDKRHYIGIDLLSYPLNGHAALDIS